MFSIEAEFNFIKEFEHFSIGHYEDGWLHYNGHDLLDDKTAEAYLGRINEIFQRLTLEVESNLIFLSDSKSKCLIYLNKIIARLEETRELLFEYHYLLLEDEHEIDGWMPVAWNTTQKRIDKLLTYCREQTNSLFKNKTGTLGKKEYSRESSLRWLKGNDKLGRLYERLVHTNIIDKIQFKQFEAHFIDLHSIDVDLKPINWNKEKYLLVMLFDELDNRSYLHKSFRANCDALISKHFTHKGKPITPRQLTSSRHTFKQKSKNADIVESGSYAVILKILVQVFENTGTQMR